MDRQVCGFRLDPNLEFRLRLRTTAVKESNNNSSRSDISIPTTSPTTFSTIDLLTSSSSSPDLPEERVGRESLSSGCPGVKRKEEGPSVADRVGTPRRLDNFVLCTFPVGPLGIVSQNTIYHHNNM
jgi:hypothetical protein